MGELAASRERVLVPLTGGHSVFYLNYSIIYIKVTGIFLRFIIRDNNLLPLSHSYTILFLFTTSSSYSSYVLFSLFFGDLFHRHWSSSSHRFIPAPFLFSLFFSICICIYIYRHNPFPSIRTEPVLFVLT